MRDYACPPRSQKPEEILASAVAVGAFKARLRWDHMFCLSIMAGIYISLAFTATLMMLGGFSNITNGSSFNAPVPAFPKFLGAAIFPFGLILIVIAGGELVRSDDSHLESVWRLR